MGAVHRKGGWYRSTGPILGGGDSDEWVSGVLMILNMTFLI